MCGWKWWASKFGDTLGGGDRASLEVYLEVYLEVVDRKAVDWEGCAASLWVEHAGAYMGVYSQVNLGVSCRLRVCLGA
jgi:hypothetical protein